MEDILSRYSEEHKGQLSKNLEQKKNMKKQLEIELTKSWTSTNSLIT